jgi:hypothetical protein
MPTAWSAALAADTVTIPNVNWFASEGVDDIGNAVYGTYHTGTTYGIGSVALDKGGLREISSVPASGWGGVLWMSVSNPWVVWAESIPGQDGAWDLKAWNSTTGLLSRVASSRLLAGQYTFPVVNQNYIAWSQATSDTSSEIRVYTFATHTTAVLDSGRVSPPVFAGGHLIWGKYVGSATDPMFQMVNGVTLAPETVPAPLAKPTPMVYLAGSPSHVLWTQSQSAMSAYDFQTRSVTNYQMAHRDGRHYFQFPMLAGGILTWWSGVVSTVVDLTTGDGFEVTNGAAAGSGNLLVISGARGTLPTLSALNLASSGGIAGCG